MGCRALAVTPSEITADRALKGDSLESCNFLPCERGYFACLTHSNMKDDRWGGGLVEGEGGLLGYYWGRTMGRNAMVLQWVSEQEKHKCWATQNYQQNYQELLLPMQSVFLCFVLSCIVTA